MYNTIYIILYIYDYCRTNQQLDDSVDETTFPNRGVDLPLPPRVHAVGGAVQGRERWLAVCGFKMVKSGLIYMGSMCIYICIYIYSVLLNLCIYYDM